MTTPFRACAKCPACGYRVPLETPFYAWVRAEPGLDSRDAGITRFDLDMLVHRYKFTSDGIGARTLQCMMFVEVKTNGADVTEAQRDSLSTLSQVLRNRRPNSPLRAGKRVQNSSPRLQAKNHRTVAVVYSQLTKKRHALRLFGGHLLRLEGEEPKSSKWLLWDNQPITAEQLVKLLRFELDPDTIKPLDTRRRYRSVRSLVGWTCRHCGEEFDSEVCHCPLCDGHYPSGSLCNCTNRK